MRKPRTQEAVQLCCVASPEKIHVVDRRCWPLHNMHFFFKLLSEFIGYYAGRGHSQDNESDLTVSLAGARHVEVREFGPRPAPQRSSCFPVTRLYSRIASSTTLKCLDDVPLTAEVLTYQVETLSPFSRPFCLRGL